MAFHKTHHFPKILQKAAFSAKAFAHPERLHILNLLTLADEMTVWDITHRSPLARPTISQHLSIMRRHNLVHWRTETPFTYYSINKDGFARTIDDLADALKDIGT